MVHICENQFIVNVSKQWTTNSYIAQLLNQQGKCLVQFGDYKDREVAVEVAIAMQKAYVLGLNSGNKTDCESEQ